MATSARASRRRKPAARTLADGLRWSMIAVPVSTTTGARYAQGSAARPREEEAEKGQGRERPISLRVRIRQATAEPYRRQQFRQETVAVTIQARVKRRRPGRC